MRYSLTLIICLCLIFKLEAQIKIDEKNFPDENFRVYLTQRYDSDGDGELSARQLSSITVINNYHDENVKTLEGISFFYNLQELTWNGVLESLDVSGCSSLQTLDCNNNQLTSLNVSGCSSLQTLYCSYNQLVSLDVSGCSSLQSLNCSFNNQLVSLDVNGCSSLQTLDCRCNQLVSLDVSGCSSLQTLYCHNNQLTSLDVSGFGLLQTLECYSNQLVSLDVSGCSSLQTLNCTNNQLTSLDVSGFGILQTLNCTNNQLTRLDVSGCSSLQTLECNYNRLRDINVRDCLLLEYLRCGRNQLLGLDLSNNSLLKVAGEGSYNSVISEIEFVNGIDLVDYNFDASKVSELENARIEENLLIGTGEQITYKYNTGYQGDNQYIKNISVTIDNTLFDRGKLPWYATKDQFHDIDGDGIKEFIDGYTSVYKWADNEIVDTKEEILPDIGTSDQVQPIHWNNDGVLDFYKTDPNMSDVYMSTKLYISKDGEYGLSPEELPLDFRSVTDINNDGLKDFYTTKAAVDGYHGRYSIYYQCRDGSFFESDVELVSDAKSDSTFLQQWVRPYYGGATFMGGLPNLSEEMFVGGSGPMNNESQLEGIDINRDGFIDLVSSSTILYNMGNGFFAVANQPGEFIIKDVNGDAISDFIYNDVESGRVYTRIYQGNGEWKEQTLISDIELSKIFCYDFDKDEDIDILLTFDYNQDFQYSFLVLCENDGTGNFIIHENAYETMWSFLDCIDIDNDGRFEILADVEDGLYLFDNIQMSQIEEPQESLVEGIRTTSGSLFLDVDNDGYYELLFPYFPPFSINEVPRYSNITSNQSPLKMNAPTILFSEGAGMLKISWDRGVDNESSSIDLTYALRIGSQSGKDDFYFSDADVDGSRRSCSLGNMGSNLETVVDVSQWEQGDYYISVQAIDPMGRGSVWSDEIVYHHDWVKKDFSLSSSSLEPTDSLVLTISPRFDLYNYEWNIENGHIVKESVDKSRYYVLFDSAGEKKVTLSMTNKETGEGFTISKMVTLKNCGFVYSSSKWYNDLFDIDGNGSLDVMDSGGLYVNDGMGNFSKLPSIFNSNLEINRLISTVDYDMDGDLDIIVNSNKGNLIQNNGPRSFEGKDVDTFLSSNLVDLDNDGYMECSDGVNRILFNSGDNMNYETFDRSDWGDESKYFVDVNNDGFYDILWEPEREDYIILLENKGNRTFHQRELSMEKYGSVILRGVADINNDGYVDLIIYQNEYVMTIVLGSEDYIYDQSFSYLLPEPCSFSTVFDMNNDGTLDIVMREDGGYGYIVYLKDDMSYEIERYESLPTDENIRDINCDSVPDFGRYLMKSNLKNELPEAPQNIRMTQKEDCIVLEWDAAKDKETPVNKIGYNISLKKKGASGNSAYILSPQVGFGSNYVYFKGKGNVVFGAGQLPYCTYATRKEVPIRRFEAGVEYEVQIQSVDLWGAVSPMSQSYTFIVENDLYIKSNSEVGVNKIIELTCEGPVQDWNNISVDLDGGTLVSQSQNVLEVSWNVPGTKNITINTNNVTVQKTIIVRDRPDMTFEFPDSGYAGVEYELALPQPFVDALSQKREISSSDEQLIVKQQNDRQRITVIFSTPGSQWIELKVRDELFGDLSYKAEIEIRDKIPVPEISLVKVDQESGKNMVLWTTEELPGYIDRVNVYKEGPVYNQFDYIGSANPIDGGFIDVLSNPQVSSNRYQLRYQTSDGCEGGGSKPHSGIHLMLNHSVGSGINLMWNQYEGGMIESFVILRGQTKDAMEEIAQVSGSVYSYTDMTAGNDAYYYALSYDKLVKDASVPIFMKSENNMYRGGMSNVVSTQDAYDIVLAEQINIVALEKDIKLTPEQLELHFNAELFPIDADIRNVQWQIMEGSDLAEINQNGLLVSKGQGNGKIVVRATTKDGSNVYAEVVVLKEGFIIYPERVDIISEGNKMELTPEQQSLQLSAVVSPDGAPQAVEWSIVEGEDLASISQDGLLTAVGIENGTIVVRAEVAGYPDIYNLFTVEKKNFIVYINIISEGNKAELTPEQQSLQLSAVVSPDEAPQTVEWSIVEGEDLASISQDGLLTAVGVENGTIVVRAEVTGYPDIYDLFTVEKRGFIIYPERVIIESENGVEELTPENPTLQLIATVYPLNASQLVEWNIISGSGLATLSDSGLLESVGFDNGTIKVMAVSTSDYSVYDELEIEKHFFSGIEDAEFLNLRCWVKSNLYVTGFPIDVETTFYIIGMDGVKLHVEKHKGEDLVCINIQNLSKGIYMLAVEYDDKIEILKFVRSE